MQSPKFIPVNETRSVPTPFTWERRRNIPLFGLVWPAARWTHKADRWLVGSRLIHFHFELSAGSNVQVWLLNENKS